ncbi:hypothetical protein [Fluviicola sp.]|jgi:hypothetical protein|uniref:hypothetical protein n=1 Tax=Fluviicola sp. TaxID=1917219 RepID=UPI0028363858|nr:hypothetical protein [Fluviicola sp.]MDR0802630.1 DUF4276 family protein [Fluviicola sp.]
MIILHIFTEELSAKNVFDEILPKIIPGISYRIYPHQGKQDLHKALKTTIPSISKIPGSRILITRDQDNQDCKDVKNDLAQVLDGKCVCPYSIRIVCRELESWFLGDLNAIKQAYPRFKPEQHIGKADFKNVDLIAIPKNYLLRIIPEYHNAETLPKLETSSKISQFLDLDNNTSMSFQFTISAIKQLVSA